MVKLLYLRDMENVTTGIAPYNDMFPEAQDRWFKEKDVWTTNLTMMRLEEDPSTLRPTPESAVTPIVAGYYQLSVSVVKYVDGTGEAGSNVKGELGVVEAVTQVGDLDVAGPYD